MRKQHQRNYPSRIRPSGGQTTLQSFLFKPRVVDGEVKPSLAPRAATAEDEEPISPPAPPKREIIRVTNKTIKEKASAFSSVGSTSTGKSGGGEASGASALDAAVFKRFNSSTSSARAEAAAAVGVAAEAEGDEDGGGCAVRLDVEEIAAGSHGREARKRKFPLGDDERESRAKHVLVLGDNPKPRPAATMRRQATPTGRGGDGDQALYNHYASGGGWWHGDMEGVDGEEIGWTDDMWEGMGSITLGGMEWH